MEILSTLLTLFFLCGFTIARPYADSADANRTLSISTTTCTSTLTTPIARSSTTTKCTTTALRSDSSSSHHGDAEPTSASRKDNETSRLADYYSTILGDPDTTSQTTESSTTTTSISTSLSSSTTSTATTRATTIISTSSQDVPGPSETLSSPGSNGQTVSFEITRDATIGGTTIRTFPIPQRRARRRQINTASFAESVCVQQCALERLCEAWELDSDNNDGIQQCTLKSDITSISFKEGSVIGVRIQGGGGSTTTSKTATVSTTAASASSTTSSTTVSASTTTSSSVISTTTAQSSTSTSVSSTTTTTHSSTSSSISSTVSASTTSSSASSTTTQSSTSTSVSSTTITQSSASTSASSTTTQSSTTTSAACTPSPTSSTGKRGLSYNYANVTNLFSSTTCPSSVSSSESNSKVSWAYNWYSAPQDSDLGPSGGPLHPNLQFVPMLWSAAPDLTSVWPTNVAAAKLKGWTELLAFNEPDLCIEGAGASCIPINDAVTAYQKFISPLSNEGFRLGAPAVTNGQGFELGNDWLVKFLDRCGDDRCRIDFIPIHWYGGASDFDSFFSHLYYTRDVVGGGKYPIWVTEFGVTSGTDEEVEEFMRVTMREMDRLEWVEKYSWFMAGAPGSSAIRGNLVSNGELSKFGELYDKF